MPLRCLSRRTSLWPLALLLCAVWPLIAPHVALAEGERLLDQEPFDEITLNAENGHHVLKVVPLDLPQRRVPENPPANARLRVRLLDRPGAEYELAWFSIDSVKLYEQMLLDEAKQLQAEGNFAAAFENYRWLLQEQPSLPGLNPAVEAFLVQSAAAAFKSQEYAHAYAQLLQLHERDPSHPMVKPALGAVADQLIAEWVRGENYVAARGVFDLLDQKFPEPRLPPVVQWEKRFVQKGKQLHEQAQQDFAAGRFSQARRWNQQTLEIWPTLAAARELAKEISQRAPQVVVGVARLGGPQLTDRLDDWPSRRRRRLIRRTLSEQIGLGAAGGVYRCPVGQFEIDPLSNRFAIQLRSGTAWNTGEGTVTGYDVSQRLLQLASPTAEEYRPDWADLLKSVAVQDVYHVAVELRHPHPRPEALLQIPLYPATAEPPHADATPSFAPYVRGDVSEREVRYRPREGLAAAELPEIVERSFADEEEAVAALRSGEIAVLDRVPPWLLAQLQADPAITVGRYALPTVHVLIPHPRKPLVNSRTFRRALLYGLHREMILREELLGGAELDGAAVLSGPFPTRTSYNDATGYASDPQIEPRPYEPRMAFALAQAALKEVPPPEAKQPSDEEPALPTLVLAHPGEPVARAACLAIQAHLQRIGFSVRLVEWNAGNPAASVDDYDLLYAQLAMWEPLVDARRLLGADQLLGRHDPHLELALQQLDEAVNSTQIGQRLRAIHRLVHDNLTVLPLWQIPEHFAYNRTVSQIGQEPVTLYQEVEQWQTHAQVPEEQ